MTCKICLDPIDSISVAPKRMRREIPKFSQSWDANDWPLESIKFLSANCVNCYLALPEMPKHTFRWYDAKTDTENEREYFDQLNQCRFDYIVCRYLIEQIRIIYRTKKRKPRNPVEIIIPPPPGNDRKLLMLKNIFWAAHRFDAEPRDLANLIRTFGASALWRWQSVHRHYRKLYGIKGDICRMDGEEEHAWRSFQDWKQRIEMAERDMIRLREQEIIYSWQTTVWQTEYRNCHTHPLAIRLWDFKRWKKMKKLNADAMQTTENV